MLAPTALLELAVTARHIVIIYTLPCAVMFMSSYEAIYKLLPVSILVWLFVTSTHTVPATELPPVLPEAEPNIAISFSSLFALISTPPADETAVRLSPSTTSETLSVIMTANVPPNAVPPVPSPAETLINRRYASLYVYILISSDANITTPLPMSAFTVFCVYTAFIAPPIVTVPPDVAAAAIVMTVVSSTDNAWMSTPPPDDTTCVPPPIFASISSLFAMAATVSPTPTFDLPAATAPPIMRAVVSCSAAILMSPAMLSIMSSPRIALVLLKKNTIANDPEAVSLPLVPPMTAPEIASA